MTTRLKWITIAIGTAVVVSTLALWFLWLAPQPRVLIVGSTTTTQDTGLLDVLQTEYTRQTGRPVRIVVAGTGAILQQRRERELHCLLTHHRSRGLTVVASEHLASRGGVRGLVLDGRGDVEPLAVARTHGEPDRGRPGFGPDEKSVRGHPDQCRRPPEGVRGGWVGVRGVADGSRRAGGRRELSSRRQAGLLPGRRRSKRIGRTIRRSSNDGHPAR